MDVTEPRIQVVIKADHRDVLRHTISVLSQFLDQKARSQIAVAYECGRHILGKLQHIHRIDLTCLNVPIVHDPFLFLLQSQLQKSLLITKIPVRNTLGSKQGSHISNFVMSHPIQIVGQFIGSVITVGNNGIAGFPSVIIVQIDHRDPGFCIQMLQVSIHHLTDNDNAIHLAFLYQLRHSAVLFL